MARKLTGMDIVQRSIAIARERRVRALALHLSGLTIQQVADKFGISRQRTALLISRARREAQSASKAQSA